MVSGKYSALSGAVAREQAMSNLAANLANVNTTGFKKDRISFSAMLKGAKQTSETQGINYARIRKIGADFSQGGMQTTGRNLDVAIDGPGFLKVMKNDEIFYTRAGRLMLDSNGMVKTEDGFTVLGAGDTPLQIDTSLGKDIVIAESGEIAVNGTLAGSQVQVFSIKDQDKLVKVGHSLYKLAEGDAQPLTDYRVIQGNLEASNVNMMEEMTSMIATQRAFEAHTKVIESYSQLSQKQDELGSIG
ncbi:flagellar basal-body rod protein FlgF [uncultured Desulfobulbus sp.]|uniref:flagellar basal-body rod protein FlgF n=1 Tax=uncultured Desulfobulbus sp. TaxID=239745 RepID=UPI0029C7280D|nr:flagellar basal-body rod protein FlgF [uncultured Desulfobulbus sp.]